MNSNSLITGVLATLACLGCHANTVDIPIEVASVDAFNSASPPYGAGDVVITLAHPVTHGLQCSSTSQFAMPSVDDPQHKALRMLRYLQRHDVLGGSVTISDAPTENHLCTILGVQIP